MMEKINWCWGCGVVSFHYYYTHLHTNTPSPSFLSISHSSIPSSFSFIQEDPPFVPPPNPNFNQSPPFSNCRPFSCDCCAPSSLLIAALLFHLACGVSYVPLELACSLCTAESI